MRGFLYFTFISICAIAITAQIPPRRFITKKFKNVNGRRMAYVEVGKGDPIVFLHGNPTSSFLWRNIMPHLENKGRLIAPDLIGLGDSEKLPPGDPSRYIILQHTNFLFTLLEKLGVKERVTFVIHDWGSALGFLWAYRNRFNPNAVKGIAFMEALVTPFTSASRPDLNEFFEPLRGPSGEELILQNNFFIESVLPDAIIRNLTTREMAEYRRPFKNAGEDRRPMLTFPRQIPFDGMPSDVVDFVERYSRYMVAAKFPKLLVVGNPGLILQGDALEVARSWENIDEVTVPGIHYVQEDSPDEIGNAISNWMDNMTN